jgi:hypothetical protein
MLDEDRHGVFISDGMMTQATDGHGLRKKKITANSQVVHRRCWKI